MMLSPWRLDDPTGMPDGPDPDAAAINDWSLSSFDTYFTAVAWQRARACAKRAVVIVTTGRGVRQWHASREAAVLGMLAAAEEATPPEDRPWHAGRLDAYAKRHGLKGWYRYDGPNGAHRIQVNLIRTRADGDCGRHYVHSVAPLQRDMTPHWGVDRDTGRTVYRAVHPRIARQWISERESG